MDTRILVLIVLGVVVVVAIGIAIYAGNRRKRESELLRAKFGPEYGRMVEETGDRARAEAALVERQRRVSKFVIHALTAAERAQCQTAWQKVQSTFVDDPKEACHQADSLIQEVMAKRGYPVEDFEQQAADLSVDHPIVVQNYRTAHSIALRHKAGEAETEDLRQAMIHYRALLDDLVANTQHPVAKAS